MAARAAAAGCLGADRPARQAPEARGPEAREKWAARVATQLAAAQGAAEAVARPAFVPRHSRRLRRRFRSTPLASQALHAAHVPSASHTRCGRSRATGQRGASRRSRSSSWLVESTEAIAFGTLSISHSDFGHLAFNAIPGTFGRFDRREAQRPVEHLLYERACLRRVEDTSDVVLLSTQKNAIQRGPSRGTSRPIEKARTGDASGPAPGTRIPFALTRSRRLE